MQHSAALGLMPCSPAPRYARGGPQSQRSAATGHPSRGSPGGRPPAHREVQRREVYTGAIPWSSVWSGGWLHTASRARASCLRGMARASEPRVMTERQEALRGAGQAARRKPTPHPAADLQADVVLDDVILRRDDEAHAPAVDQQDDLGGGVARGFAGKGGSKPAWELQRLYGRKRHPASQGARRAAAAAPTQRHGARRPPLHLGVDARPERRPLQLIARGGQRPEPPAALGHQPPQPLRCSLRRLWQVCHVSGQRARQGVRHILVRPWAVMVLPPPLR